LKKPELVQLIIPSLHHSKLIDAFLHKAEEHLCKAAARTSLSKLQHHLRTRNIWLDLKSKHVRGVKSCTRMNHSLNSVHTKIRAAVWLYRQHWSALLALQGTGKWTRELRELKDADIRGVNERALTEKEAAESRR
jgi:hypothetical protein